MVRQLNRIAPQLPVTAVKTYQAVATSDQTVVAACATVGCDAWRYGWDTMVNENTELGKRQAAYIRRESGRSFTELPTRRDGAGATVFRFEPYQRCFANHETRPARYLVRGGDHRANTGLITEHVDSEDWVEDFAEHQDALAHRLGQG
jgi:hypothetical protein